MTRTRSFWLPLAVLAAVLAAGAGLVGLSTARANPATVSISSATVAPGADATVTLSVTPAAGEQVGALTVDIQYNNSVLDAKSCQNKAAASAACNVDFAANTVRYTVASTEPLSGALADITFGTLAAGSSNLTLSITTCANVEGGNLTCTAQNGTVTVQEATPTPVPATPAPTTPAATATPAPPTPTRTPASVPATGGAAGEGDSMLPLALGALGLAAIAGGVFAVARMRREGV